MARYQKLTIVAATIFIPLAMALLFVQHVLPTSMPMGINMSHGASVSSCAGQCSNNALIEQAEQIRVLRTDIEPVPPPTLWIITSLVIATIVTAQALRRLRRFDIPLYKWHVCYLS